MKSRRDPKLFREMSEPFETREAAEKAVDAFCQGVAELRKEHKIQNVYLIARFSVIDEEGDEVERALTVCLGDQAKAVEMAAMAYGQECKAREDLIAGIVKSARSRR